MIYFKMKSASILRRDNKDENEEEEEEDEDGDLSKYNLWGSDDENTEEKTVLL